MSLKNNVIIKLSIAFPRLYEWRLHLRRLKKIKEINALKKKTIDEKRDILSNVYKEKIGHELNWNNMETYTEKMQWEKLYHVDPRKSQLADKYLVRDWVKKQIGEEYLISVFGVWDSFDQIDFDKLPNQFVLKTNHGSGTNLIVKNKKKIDMWQTKLKIDDWMKMDFTYTTWFEMHYSEINPKIIAEQYMETSIGELQDYKFLCFDGKPYFCWVDLGRYSKHTRTVFDMNWKLQPWTQAEYGIFNGTILKPKNYEKMIELATILCQGFAHVRVDFYNIDGTIYFGEMTFTNGSGLDKIIPEEYDKELGKLWNIPELH